MILSFVAALSIGAPSVMVLPIEGFNVIVPIAWDDQVYRTVSESVGVQNMLPPPAISLEMLRLGAACGDDHLKCVTQISQSVGGASVIATRITLDPDDALWLDIDRSQSRKRRPKTHHIRLGPWDEFTLQEIQWHMRSALGVKQVPLRGKLRLDGLGEETGFTVHLNEQKRQFVGAVESVVPGRYVITVEHAKFETVAQKVDVHPLRTTEFYVSLRPRAFARLPQATPALGADAADAQIHTAPTTEGSVHWSTWALGGAALVSVAVGTAYGIQVLNANQRVEQGDTCEVDDFCSGARIADDIVPVAWTAAALFAAGSVASYFLLGTPAPAVEGPISGDTGPAVSFDMHIAPDAKSGGLGLACSF